MKNHDKSDMHRISGEYPRPPIIVRGDADEKEGFNDRRKHRWVG